MLTESEKKLIDLLIKIEHDKDCVIGAYLLAKESKMIEVCVSFIEENPDVSYDDIFNFLLDDYCFEETTE